MNQLVTPSALGILTCLSLRAWRSSRKLISSASNPAARACFTELVELEKKVRRPRMILSGCKPTETDFFSPEASLSHEPTLREPTDMRNRFEGLFGLVLDTLGKDPLSGHLFLVADKTRP